MKIKGLALAVLTAGLIAGTTTSAVAQDVPNWIGFSAGNTQFSGNNLAGINPTSSDKSDNAWKLVLGIPFNKNLALELGYAKLGDQSISGTYPATGVASSARTTNTAYLIDLVGTYDINASFAILGKVGMHRWGVNSDRTGITAPGANQSDGADGFNSTYGLGLQYNINPDVGLRLEWEKINHMGHDTTTGISDARLISVGVVYKFKIL